MPWNLTVKTSTNKKNFILQVSKGETPTFTIDFPQLIRIKVFEQSFERVGQLEMVDFPMLLSVDVGRLSFTHLHSLVLKDNMALQSFCIQQNELMELRTVELSSMIVWRLSSRLAFSVLICC